MKSRLRRIGVATAMTLAGLAGPVLPARADGPVDPGLLCAGTPRPDACLETERRVWLAVTEAAVSMDPASLPDFCGTAACTLRATLTASLATQNPGGVTCALGATCDLLPAIVRMRENGLGNDEPYADDYVRLDSILRKGLGDGEAPSVEEITFLVLWLSGTPPLPEGIADLRELAASRNLSAAKLRLYGNGEGEAVVTPAGTVEIQTATSTSDRAGLLLHVPPGCTAAFVFGDPWFFRQKTNWGFGVDFHYGQHLDSFSIVDRRGPGGPNVPCPPTEATIRLSVGARHRQSSIVGPTEEMNKQAWERRVTARADAPYINCYDRQRCNVVQIYADDSRSIAEVEIPPRYWPGGHFFLDLYHTWDLSHGYSDDLYGGGDGDGYDEDHYDQHCKWSGGFDAMVPEFCDGNG